MITWLVSCLLVKRAEMSSVACKKKKLVLAIKESSFNLKCICCVLYCTALEVTWQCK